MRQCIETALQLTVNDVRHRARLARDLRPTPTVLGSDTRLTQVLVNLITNAAQSIELGDPEGQVVRVACYTGSASEAVVEVGDTGSGIAREVRSRIFDPFFTTKPMGQGTGLGLTIVHRMVTEMGGRVDVESEPGRGTTLRVTLPGIATDPEEPAPAGVAATATSVAGTRPRVLVVDDDVAVAQVVRRLLSSRFDPVVAHSGAAALAILGAERVDAIVCDLMMPGMDGAALHAEIERRHPALARRMIFVTGGTFAPHLDAFLARVANQRLDKPLDRKQLVAALDGVLGR